MRPGAYCCVIVMDLRKKSAFYPFHSDIADFMRDIGFVYDDIIIWDRRHEYNNMRPLGYPSVFRVNKAHEFILIFQKPDRSVAPEPDNEGEREE
jgi:DNA modification methylase